VDIIGHWRGPTKDKPFENDWTDRSGPPGKWYKPPRQQHERPIFRKWLHGEFTSPHEMFALQIANNLHCKLFFQLENQKPLQQLKNNCTKDPRKINLS